jgi:hypothetical protein
MPPAVHSARQRSREGWPGTQTPDANPGSALSIKSGVRDYAARDPNEIAAHFPVPSADVATRLVDLLLLRRPAQPNVDESARRRRQRRPPFGSASDVNSVPRVRVATGQERTGPDLNTSRIEGSPTYRGAPDCHIDEESHNLTPVH